LVDQLKASGGGGCNSRLSRKVTRRRYRTPGPRVAPKEGGGGLRVCPSSNISHDRGLRKKRTLPSPLSGGGGLASELEAHRGWGDTVGLEFGKGSFWDWRPEVKLGSGVSGMIMVRVRGGVAVEAFYSGQCGHGPEVSQRLGAGPEAAGWV